MEQSDGLVSVVVYLAILAFAVAWFLLPRWLKQRKADRLAKAADDAARAKPAAGSDLR
jgi:hypothetical protein